MFVLQDNISIIIIDKLMTVCHKVFLTFIFTILTVLIPALLYTCFSEIIKSDKQKPIMKGIFNMKKTITALLALTMAASLAGCGSKPADEPTKSPETVIESAVDFYTEVWDALGEDRQFAAVGGDAEHEAEAPAKFAMTDENKEIFEYLLHVNDELYDMLDDDTATLQHMMNTNTFSSAFAKLKSPSKAEEFAEDYKAEIQGQHWMCGFPDKVVVISVADYVMMAYGAEECVDDLVEACSEVAPDSTVLVDAPAVLD